MRIAVTLVIEMTDQQAADYAEYARISTRAKDVVADVRSFAAAAVTLAFETGAGSGADVSIRSADR
jgi:hypothetical protein